MHGGNVVECFLLVGGDYHALAASQAVVFHHIRGTELRKGVDLKLLSATDRYLECTSGAYPGAGHDVFREGFGSLNLRGSFGRAEDGEASVAQHVSHARDQGNLGADDHEISVDVACQLQRLAFRVHRGYGGHAGVAG